MPHFGLDADRPAVFDRVLADDALAARPTPSRTKPAKIELAGCRERAASARSAPSPAPHPRAARSLGDNSQFEGSPSVRQLALVMPSGSQRCAASTRLNERKCGSLTPTIFPMTLFDQAAFQPYWGHCVRESLVHADRFRGRANIAKHAVGECQTACRPVADKRQLPLCGGPISRSTSDGPVLQ